MKKILGYGFKLSKESLVHAYKSYYTDGLSESKKIVLKEIKKAKATGIINKKAKPKVFKVVLEIV